MVERATTQRQWELVVVFADFRLTRSLKTNSQLFDGHIDLRSAVAIDSAETGERSQPFTRSQTVSIEINSSRLPMLTEPSNTFRLTQTQTYYYAVRCFCDRAKANKISFIPQKNRAPRTPNVTMLIKRSQPISIVRMKR